MVVSKFFPPLGPLDGRCPTLIDTVGRMKHSRSPVTLEPELEEMAALWTPAKRLEMARYFTRWARQLKVSAFILSKNSNVPKAVLRPLPQRKQALN